MDNSNPSFKKNKRKLTKPRNMQKVGEWTNGKIYYPHSVKSHMATYGRYKIRGFRLHTHYHSILEQEKKPLTIGVFAFTQADTLKMNIGVRSHELPMFIKKESLFRMGDYYVTADKLYDAQTPKRMIVPHRRTLDNHGLNITLFQRDNYIGIPTYVATRDKEKIKEGWFYTYNTVVNGLEGIYIECVGEIPFLFRGDVYRV